MSSSRSSRFVSFIVLLTAGLPRDQKLERASRLSAVISGTLVAEVLTPVTVNTVIEACEVQSPVVTVLVTPSTTSTTSLSANMSKLRPKASGFKVK